MPESIEQWLWLTISAFFIGFVYVVILAIFPSPITWLCLGLLTGILFLYPVVRNLPTSISGQKSRRAQSSGAGPQDLLISVTKQLEPLISVTKQPQPLGQGTRQQQLPRPKSKQQQTAPKVKKTSLDAPDVQNYIPPGLPPDLFL